MLDCYIIARLSSARLLKNILKINNKPLFINLYNRIKSKFVDRIIVCTSDEKRMMN